jgi:transcriptional regulator with XRE-family HTH domain
MKMAKKKFQSIKDARISISKTQQEMAKASGISESYYNLIENGKRRPPVDLAAVLSKELNITLDDFFTLYNFTKCKVGVSVI